MLTIRPFGEKMKQYLNRSDARYLAGELVQVRVTRKGFLPEYVPMQTAQWREYPPKALITAELLQNHPNWACFFAFWDERFVGQVVMRPSVHRLCELVDLRVDATVRRKGIATGLLNACVDFASEGLRMGLMVETSDQNPVACQFLQSCNFSLGGVDKLRYFADKQQESKAPGLRDSALTFYRFF